MIRGQFKNQEKKDGGKQKKFNFYKKEDFSNDKKKDERAKISFSENRRTFNR